MMPARYSSKVFLKYHLLRQHKIANHPANRTRQPAQSARHPQRLAAGGTSIAATPVMSGYSPNLASVPAQHGSPRARSPVTVPNTAASYSLSNTEQGPSAPGPGTANSHGTVAASSYSTPQMYGPQEHISRQSQPTMPNRRSHKSSHRRAYQPAEPSLSASLGHDWCLKHFCTLENRDVPVAGQMQRRLVCPECWP